MIPIDIFLLTYERQQFAQECARYIRERTITPYWLTVLDNGGNEWAKDNPQQVDRYISLGNALGNTGVHFPWNVAASLARGKYFITSDPDLLVPDLSDGDWLSRMIKFMDERPDYGAISLCPHVFIGAANIDPNDPNDVLERNMCGAVFRIMRTEMVREVRGWDLVIEPGRNHEERTICSRLQAAGYKTGIASRVRAYHNFGKNWGYPKEFTPEMQKHTPELAEYVTSFDNRDAYDSKTWLPK